MELYTLDPLLRRLNVIDQFESLIWTERFNAFGDFQLDIASTFGNRNRLQAGTFLALSESLRVMMVETIEDTTDEQGRKKLTVKGRSLEALLLDRVAKESTSDLTVSPKWKLTGAPGTVARKIFHDICVTGILNTADIIPFIHEGPDVGGIGNISEPTDPISVEIEPTTVYEAIQEICVVWSLGFRLLRNYDMSELYFDVYAGSDRTTSQTELAPVVFTPELDNLQNTKSFTSIEKTKNVAYVFSPAGFLVVYAADADSSTAGFDRRVLTVNASDITTDNLDVPAALLQRGMEELSKNRSYKAFDGEISQRSRYKYGVDYNLGDIVEMRNDDGATNNMRVTEQIFVSDREGVRSYPTLTIDVFITEGSWLSWMKNKVWAELGPTEYWANQP